jgi:hypothetical protein
VAVTTPKRFAPSSSPGGVLLCVLLLAAPLSAQDLDPRAYANVPVNGTFLVSGFWLSHGGVVSDPTLPVKDLRATVKTPSVRTWRETLQEDLQQSLDQLAQREHRQRERQQRHDHGDG